MATLDYKSSLGRYRRYLAVASERPMVKASLFLVLSLILLIVLLLFALKPTLVTISGLLGQIRQQRVIVTKLDQKVLDISRSQQVYAQNQLRLTLLDQALPTHPALQEFTTSVEVMASESGVNISSVTFANVGFAGKVEGVKYRVSLPEAVTPVGFTLVMQGEYGPIRNLVERLEGLRRIMEIESVQIISGDEKDRTLTLTVKGVVGETNF